MKRGLLRIIIGIMLFSFSNSSLIMANELTEDYFDIATNYFNTNNYSKSLEYLDNILKIEPENLPAQVLKNKILNLSAAKPEDPVVLKDGSLLKKDQDGMVILNIPQADTEKMAYDSDYYNLKGQEFYQKKDYGMAVEYFHKAIRLNPKNQQAYNNLAMAYWQKDNMCVAIKFFKKANSINKSYTQPLVNLSLLYAKLGERDKQLQYLKKAVKQNPNDYWAYYLLGEFYKNKINYPLAIENYKEAITINNKFSQAYMGLALCFFETEEFKYALLTLQKYLELNPDSDFALFMMARADLVLGQYEAAKSNIERAIKIKDKPEYQFELGKINYYLEDYWHALEIFESLLQKVSSAEIFNYAGLCEYKFKNIQSAIANFNRAIEIDLLRPIYYYNLAQCYKSTGDKKNYRKYMDSAMKITPINYQDFVDLSYIYYDNLNAAYALNTLNEGLKKYPNAKALYLSKMKIYEALGDNLNYNEIKSIIEEKFNANEEKK